MELKEFLQKSVKEKISLEDQEKFLVNKTDITAEELKTVIDFLKKEMPITHNFENGIDICGTGGSGLNRINTSTISAFILASLGVKIAKHGNRASSGRFGSFDLIENLGIDIENSSKNAKKYFKEENLALLFAPTFHPIMRFFSPVRKKIGKPTFFNILGPLLNPGNTKTQIIGTSSKDNMHLMGKTCKLIGKKHVFIVCGEDNLDEITLTGKTYVTELKNGNIKSYTISPKNFGITKSPFKKIEGGTSDFNTKIAKEILSGKCKSRHLDLVLINTALALKLSGKAKTLKEGYKFAKSAIKSGKALKKLESIKRKTSIPSILKEIVDNKKKEVEKSKKILLLDNLKNQMKPNKRNFEKAISKKGLNLIAEIKKTSPSNKKSFIKKFSPSSLSKTYEQSKTDAISILTDKKYFSGNLKHLEKTYKSTKKVPLLFKDFIIDEYQIYEARKNGASAILLIAAILSKKQIKDFLKIAKELKMSAICEVHNKEELKKVLKTPAKIIGINNRNLHTFKTDLNTTTNLAKLIPKSKIIVSESGISTKDDIQKLPKNINAVLVGTSIMKSKNIKEKIQELKNTKKFLLKICGVRTINTAKFCDKNNIDLIGLNFVPSSHRKITTLKAKSICENIKHLKKVGIFQNQQISIVNKIAKKLNLDFIQLSGNEDLKYIKKCIKPVIKTIKVSTKKDLEKAKKYISHISYLILDGKTPGSGKTFNTSIIKNFKEKYLLAGGINPKNIHSLKNLNPLGFDIASGIETNKKIDHKKIYEIIKKISD
jgi:anthranilate phosphoribosyltransferase